MNAFTARTPSRSFLRRFAAHAGLPFVTIDPGREGEADFVAVNPLVRPLLEREELVGAEVALIVARALARQDRREFVGVRSAHQIRISSPASGTPPSSVTSQVSCI